MRLRIQTRPPLPELKAWYSPRPNDVPSTISELKQAICGQIPPLKAHGVSGSHILLLLDDFELLDDNPLDVVRDGDLICIKALPDVSMKTEDELEGGRVKKRKREQSMFISGRSVQSPNFRPSNASKPVKKPPTDSDSSDESTSSVSSSSSSSSSSTTSTSSSVSSSSVSSSSASSSSGPPVPRPSKPSRANQLKATVLAVPSQPLGPTVPPGFGKPQTHSRNLRRRIKRIHDKQSQLQSAEPVPAPPKNSSAPNVVPLGPKRVQSKRDRDGPAGDVAAALNSAFGSNAEGGELTPGTRMDEGMDVEMESTTQIAQETSTVNDNEGKIMMATLRNKNKRKGFKQSMAAPLPRKIVFDDNTNAHVASGAGAASTQPLTKTLMAELPGVEAVVPAPPRLVPPSEKQERGELPPRMFVTSVDVEDGMWAAAPRKKKQKKKEQVQENWEGQSYEDTAVPDVQLEEDTRLDYSEMAVVRAGALDWNRAQQEWESFAEVTDVGQLTVGTVVGWKGLALNPLTFSPEVLLSIASIIHLPDPNKERQFVVKQFPRPGGSNPSLSSRLTGIAEGEEEDEVEEEHAWHDILDSKWRLIAL